MAWETRKVINEKILKIYPYGSRVYGCHTEKSDYDYMAIVEYDGDLDYTFVGDDVHIHVVSESVFIQKVKEHHISYMECIFQKEDDPYLQYFELNLDKLRRAISAVASNSFVKCKKKLKQGEYYIGKKSMFHSLRIAGFGIQIATHGRIVDYSAYNHFLEEIMSIDSNDWKVFEDKYKPIANAMRTEFRILAPLEGENNEVIQD